MRPGSAMLGRKRAIYAFLVGVLCVANVGVAFARQEAAPDLDPFARGPGSEWWGDYHWHKTTIYSSVSRDNTEAIRAANLWNSQSILALPSSNSHTDISILRGAYGLTRWRGLAEIVLAARDPHCSNRYCEIRHCHATLNTSYAGTSWCYQGTYCMELGHCFGLDHDADVGCMNSSAMNAGQSNAPSAGNIREIAGRYAPYLF